MSEHKLLCQLFMTKRQFMDVQQCKLSVTVATPVF